MHVNIVEKQRTNRDRKVVVCIEWLLYTGVYTLLLLSRNMRGLEI